MIWKGLKTIWLVSITFDDIFEGKKLATNCQKNPFINKKNKTKIENKTFLINFISVEKL